MHTVYTGFVEVDTLLGDLWAAPHPVSAEELLQREEQHAKVAHLLEGCLTAEAIRNAHKDRPFVRGLVARALREDPRHLEDKGLRPTTILLKGGLRLNIKTPYLAVKHPPATGKRQWKQRRKGGGSGVYPVLVALGAEKQGTPLLRQEVGRALVSAASYAEASAEMERQGLKLNIKKALDWTVGLAGQMKQYRDDQIREADAAELPPTGPLAGKSVLVSVDGGRTRLREPYKVGRRKKNGRRGFEANWREPRGFIIEVLDKKGRPDPTVQPVYEMSMCSVDELFDLLGGTLRMLGAAYAAKVLFVADGADWIWDRVPGLWVRAEVPAERVTILVDFYHACEHIEAALALLKYSSVKEKQSLYRRLRKNLMKGQVDKVIAELRNHAQGSIEEAMTKAIHYFVKRRDRMAYHVARARNLPIGSGAMESAIRRINNLRFKGPGLIWRKENVDALMYIRALVKSGRLRDTHLNLLHPQSANLEMEPLNGQLAA